MIARRDFAFIIFSVSRFAPRLRFGLLLHSGLSAADCRRPQPAPPQKMCIDVHENENRRVEKCCRRKTRGDRLPRIKKFCIPIAFAIRGSLCAARRVLFGPAPAALFIRRAVRGSPAAVARFISTDKASNCDSFSAN